MPTRPVVASIFLLWFATLGFAFYRDIWPRLVATGPPPIAFDLADEASQFVPVRWQVLRGDKQVGRLTTRMTHEDADDTFRFTHHYSQLQFEVAGCLIEFPELTTTMRLTRAGDLREQTLEGSGVLQRQGPAGILITIGDGRAKMTARVENGVLVGRCEITAPLLSVNGDFEPIPVPSGQALSPLQPLNRVANVRPGQRWVVQEVNPLHEAAKALFGMYGLGGLLGDSRESLIAEVGPAPRLLAWRGTEVPCWVIEYRGDKVRAATWVQVADGKVLRQEVTRDDERLALERDE